jgi:CHAT domain-containing protein/tetratricopeptide (TPR) repeat protein
MLYAEIAKQLISAETNAKRKKLLTKFANADSLKLAFELKNICWNAWTVEPIIAKKSSSALKVLARMFPNKKIEAVSFWVSSISQITKGKLQSAISNINSAETLFIQINEEPLAAQTQISKLYVLALLGKYDEAVECGKQALKTFEKYDDELSAGKIEKNIGNIYGRQENHTQAELFLLKARQRFIKLKEYAELSMCENVLATAYAAKNDFRNAEKMYEKSLAQAKKAEMFVTQAEIEGNIGNLAMCRGKFDQAIKFLELAAQKYEDLKMPHQVAISELEIADIYLELNLVNESFEIYSKVSKTFSKLKMQGEEARSRANFGRSAMLLNDNKIARTQLAKAAKLYIAENNLVGASAVKLSESQLELSESNFEKALKLAIEAKKLLDKTSNLRYKLILNVIKAECLRNLGNFAAAKTLLEKTFDDATAQESGQIAQTVQISLGKLANAENKTSQAEKHFKKAVELIETLRSPLPAEEFRMAFLADKLVPYQELAKICIRENRIAEAFQYVQSSRSRSLTENLSFEPKVEYSDENSIKLQHKINDLREELNWFYNRLNRAAETESEKLQTEIKKREREITKVYRKLNSKSSTLLQNSSLFDFEKLQKQLGSDKILIEFIGFEDEISAFIITDSQIKFTENLTNKVEISKLLEGLQFQFGALRYGTKKLGNFTVELKKRADIYLQKLYEKLLKPFENDFKNRNLIIVPFHNLHYVPFQALHDGKNYVVENREVSFAPSAAVLQICLDKPQIKAENALLIGFADEKIPLVNSEIQVISKIFNNNVSLTNQDASFANFKKYAENFDILHIACHGQFRHDNPLFSSLHLADGSITVRDACAMRLNAAIVTLSACETGLNSVFAGDELLGLSRGFLSAGANSMLLSLWTVNDEATGELMKIFYTELKKGKSGAEALKTAQCRFIKHELHPYFWSPFILIGKP